MWTLAGYFDQNFIIYELNKVFFTFFLKKKYIGFCIRIFYLLILPPGGKIVGPYSGARERIVGGECMVPSSSICTKL
jgi:hypothetical protein